MLGVFDILKVWWSSSSVAFNSVVYLFSRSLRNLIAVDVPIVSQITDFIFSIPVGDTTLGDLSLFSFLLGSAISLFISITIIKWFIGIIT